MGRILLTLFVYLADACTFSIAFALLFAALPQLLAPFKGLLDDNPGLFLGVFVAPNIAIVSLACWIIGNQIWEDISTLPSCKPRNNE